MEIKYELIRFLKNSTHAMSNCTEGAFGKDAHFKQAGRVSHQRSQADFPDEVYTAPMTRQRWFKRVRERASSAPQG